MRRVTERPLGAVGHVTRDVRPAGRAAAAPWLGVAAVVLVAVLACTAAAVAGNGRSGAQCLAIPSDPTYLGGLLSVLAQKRDTWGDQVLAAPGGATYDAVRPKLHPLFLVGRPGSPRSGSPTPASTTSPSASPPGRTAPPGSSSTSPTEARSSPRSPTGRA